jgi:plasmid stabilization system protein ParE
MVKRKIVWTRTADIQFVGVLEYWVKRNKSSSYSKKLVRLVAKRTAEIADNPFMNKSTDFINTRVVSLGNFSIFYEVTEKQIIISSFWDNRQNPTKLLKILQNRNLKE